MSVFNPVVLQKMPLIDEHTSTYNNRELVLRQTQKDVWCVCYYLVNEDMYVSGLYFQSRTEAQMNFDDKVSEFIQHYKDIIDDLESRVEFWSSHYE